MDTLAFTKAIAKSDITHDDLTRLRSVVVYGRILKKDERHEISQCLGVLREILDQARCA